MDEFDDGQLDELDDELVDEDEYPDVAPIVDDIKVFMYAEVAVAFSPFEVGDRAHFPFEFWMKHRHYMRVVADGPRGDLPTEG